MIKKIKVRKGTYSLQGCPHWEETVVENDTIYFKHRSSTDYKPKQKHKKEVYQGKSIIPPT
jgi:hypothetical protein